MSRILINDNDLLDWIDRLKEGSTEYVIERIFSERLQIQDDFKQLYENQLAINESLARHINSLNEMIQGQLCIPDVKESLCNRCNFRKWWMERTIDENN